MEKTIAAVALCALGAVALAAGEPIVRNGTFDEVKDGKTVGWNSVGERYVYRDGAGRSGTRALCFTNDDPTFYSFPSQRIDLKPGKIYEFEVWVRTENLKGPESGASVCIEWVDAKGKWLGGAYADGVKGTRDWTCVRSTTSRIPKEAAHFSLHPYVRKGMVGRAWFDDVMVREFVPAPVEGLFSTAYRNLAADGDVTFKAALNLEPEVLAAHTAWFRYEDAAGKPRRVPAQTFDRATATLKLPVAELAKGGQKVRVEVCRRADAPSVGDGAPTLPCLGSAELTFTRVDKLPERAVWIDRLGRTIVHGKPFFPLGMYWSGVDTNRLDLYAKGPFNCLMPYNAPNKKELLDYCDAKGLKVIYSVKDVFSGTRWAPAGVKTEADEVNYITDRVSRFKDHPAVLAWYLNDELPLAMLPRLAARRELMERLDPGHPGWVVLYQYTQIRNYLPSFDVIGTDPYPIASKPALTATVWTRDTAAGTMGCKPLWQVPQAFNWGVYRKEPEERAKCRAPTEEELRSMCWQCIANGANGLVLYSFFDLSKPTVTEPFEKKWAECCRVGGEIRRFFPVLLSDERAETPPVKRLCDAETLGRAVSVRSWWKDGEAWVLIVNGGDRPVRASALLDGRFAKMCREFGAGGDFERADAISIPLPPLGVSLVRLEPAAPRTAAK